jgi:hypothetical protein
LTDLLKHKHCSYINNAIYLPILLQDVIILIII